MALIDDVKISLRITSSAYNTEITDLIEACKADLTLKGILSNDDTETLIKRAINLYVKAHMGYNNPDKEGLLHSYEMIKSDLALSSTYGFYQVTFTITDSSTSDAIQEAEIRLWNDELNYEEVKYTNVSGVAIFDVRARANYKYDIAANDYISDLHEEDDKNIQDVSGDTTVAVSLTGV